MAATTVCAEFILLGAFEPGEIANRLGFTPTRTWRCGESKHGTLLRYETDGISLSTGDREGVGLEDVVLEVLATVEHSRDEITRLRDELAAVAALDCCIYIVQDEAPSAHLSAGTLSRLVSLGASLDVDIIVVARDP